MMAGALQYHQSPHWPCFITKLQLKRIEDPHGPWVQFGQLGRWVRFGQFGSWTRGIGCIFKPSKRCCPAYLGDYAYKRHSKQVSCCLAPYTASRTWRSRRFVKTADHNNRGSYSLREILSETVVLGNSFRCSGYSINIADAKSQDLQQHFDLSIRRRLFH